MRSNDAKKITTTPISFIPRPAFIRSLVFMLPLTNIIALGGVANKTEIETHIVQQIGLTNR